MPPASKCVVFTALTGRYEELNEQPISADSEIEFICFTDDPELTSKTWTIRHVDLRFPMDTIRSARYLKVRGTELLSDYDESLWIDNSVMLRAQPEEILRSWLSSTDLALPLHSYRATVMGEFDAVATDGYDDPSRVYEQLIHYSSLHPAVLEERPYWTALLARRHTTAVTQMMQMWYDHILRYSRRDQLSINFVLGALGTPVLGVDLDNMHSEWHEWPVRAAKKWGLAQDRLANALRVPQVELGRLQNQLDVVRSELDVARSESKAVDELPARAKEVEYAQEMVRTEFRSSFSWKVTAPLRAARRFLRRT